MKKEQEEAWAPVPPGFIKLEGAARVLVAFGCVGQVGSREGGCRPAGTIWRARQFRSGPCGE
jgi:hypothetical protein